MKEERYSKIAINYPSFQSIDTLNLNGYRSVNHCSLYKQWTQSNIFLRWLESRQNDDNAEGSWRLHDDLYDLTDFVKVHPGGQDWIALTKVVYDECFALSGRLNCDLKPTGHRYHRGFWSASHVPGKSGYLFGQIPREEGSVASKFQIDLQWRWVLSNIEKTSWSRAQADQ